MSFTLLGILNAQAVGAGAVGELQLIQTQTLTAADTEVVFSGLDSYNTTYQHLHFRSDWGTNGATGLHAAYVRFNGDTTASNYRGTHIRTTGSSPFSYAGDDNFIGFCTNDSPSAAAVFDILNPFDGTNLTGLRGMSGNYDPDNSTYYSVYVSSHWDYATSLTSISFYNALGFTIGSRLSLYGYKVAA